MRKFLIKLFVYAVLLSALTAAVNLYYLNQLNKDKYLDVPDGIEICNFGSSHGQLGFNYKDFRGKYICSNFALSSQSLLYDYRVLLHYRDKIKPGAYAFIVVSYFTLFGPPEVEEASFLSKNKRYYRLLPPELITNYDRMTDLYVNYLPALSFEGMRALIRFMLFGEEIYCEHFNLDRSAWDRSVVNSTVSGDAVQAYMRHITEQLGRDGKRMRSQEAFDSLYALIDLCREIGAIPILVTVPCTRVYIDTIRKNDPEFFADFYAVIDEIKQKKNIEYYDYASDERFCDDLNLFLNSDHLNREGARRFTNILLREVLGITP